MATFPLGVDQLSVIAGGSAKIELIVADADPIVDVVQLVFGGVVAQTAVGDLGGFVAGVGFV